MVREIHTPVTHPLHPVIGHIFKAWDGYEYVCDSWESNLGYWMFRTGPGNELVRRNVSERAIGRTFHRISHDQETGIDGWNDPDVNPDKPGEYRAAVDPTNASPDVRRWWDGRGWSNPYFGTSPNALKDRIRKERSVLRVFWTPC